MWIVISRLDQFGPRVTGTREVCNSSLKLRKIATAIPLHKEKRPTPENPALQQERGSTTCNRNNNDFRSLKPTSLVYATWAPSSMVKLEKKAPRWIQKTNLDSTVKDKSPPSYRSANHFAHLSLFQNTLHCTSITPYLYNAAIRYHWWGCGHTRRDILHQSSASLLLPSIRQRLSRSAV